MNVLPLPTRVERLVKAIHNDLQRQAKGDREWIEASCDLCLHLAELRESFKSNIEFGHACEGNGFGGEVLNHQTRAAAVAMGQEPEALRACLEATQRRSLEMIYRDEFGRFTSVRKTKRPSRKQPAVGVKEQHAAVVYDRLTAEGRTFTRPDLARLAGVSPGTAARAYNRRQLEEEVRGKVEPLDPATVSPSTREKMEAWQRAERKRLRAAIEAEFEERYDFRTEPWLARIYERISWAEKTLKAYRGIMSKADYQTIVKCLHPDTAPDPKLKAEAFRLFTQHKDILIEPDLGPPGPPLPTLGELLHRKRVREEAQTAKRDRNG